MRKKQTNSILTWMELEHKPLRQALILGWATVAILAIYSINTYSRTTKSPFMLILTFVITVLYLAFTFSVMKGYLKAKKLWKNLSITEKTKLDQALNRQVILLSKIVLSENHLIMYAKGEPQLIPYEDIIWLYSDFIETPYTRAQAKQGKPIDKSKHTQISVGTKTGKIHQSITDTVTDTLYTNLGNHLNRAVYGFSSEKRALFKKDRESFIATHGIN